MKIQSASILHTCFKREHRRCSRVIWNFTPVPIRQNQHQTAKHHAARKDDLRRNVFEVSSLAADNITHGDLLDNVWLRLTPVTQYMQMWDGHRFMCSDYPRTRSLIMRQRAASIDWRSMFFNGPYLSQILFRNQSEITFIRCCGFKLGESVPSFLETFLFFISNEKLKVSWI